MNTSVRMPAVAGRFYPGNAGKLLHALENFLSVDPRRYGRSGVSHPMLDTFTREALPEPCIRMSWCRIVALCCARITPGLAHRLSIMSSGEWRTPFGPVPIDEEVAEI